MKRFLTMVAMFAIVVSYADRIYADPFVTLVDIPKSSVTLSDVSVWVDPNCVDNDAGYLAWQQNKFEPASEHAMTYGFTGNCIWLAYRVHNKVHQSLSARLYGGRIGSATYSVYQDGRLALREENGDKVPVAARTVQRSGLIFPLPPYPRETVHVIRVASDHPLFFRTVIGPPGSVVQDYELPQVLLLLTVGAVVIVCINNLLFFSALRSREFLYFVLYLICFTVTTGFTYDLFGTLFHMPYKPMEILFQIVTPFMFLFFALFSIEMLDLRKHMPRAAKAYVFFTVATMLMNPVPLYISQDFGVLLIAMIFMLWGWSLFFAITLAIRGHFSAKIYLPGVIGATLSTALYLPLYTPGQIFTSDKFITAVIGVIVEILCFSVILTWRVRAIHDEKLKAERNASTDGLTGLVNRRAFMEAAESILEERNGNEPVSVIMFDIDHFKSVNDTYGHHAGDVVLREFGDLLLKNFRKTDLVARLGGEEFAVLLKSTGPREASELAQRAIEQLRGSHYSVDQKTISVTTSAGIAVLSANEPTRSFATLLKKADTSLYQAKNNGRDQWIMAEHGQA